MKYDVYTLDVLSMIKDTGIKVNDEDFNGSIAVGDTLTVNGVHYRIQAVNEDGILVKELK